MKLSRLGLPLIACVILAGATARAEVKVTTDHNSADTATADFKFKNVPSPAKADSAPKAKFTIVDGEKDDAGADIDAVHDGKLPTEGDQPDANFYFNAGTPGGRIGADLGEAIDIKQINTYSWHTDTRAPQVYKLYASDGTAKDFNVAPKTGVDPTTVGWKLIASVDTHPKEGDVGGQYGVSITDSDGKLGSFRYLLFDVAKTESDDEFGNTFISEINILDQKGTTQPTTAPTAQATTLKFGKYTCVITTTEAPELTDWANNKLAPVVKEWYPKLVALLPSDGYEAPTHFTITFTPKYNGVAYTAGTKIVGASGWFAKGDEGAIVHEMVHVVQQYGSARRTNPNPTRPPGWLIEGIPDYIRWYKYEPTSKGADMRRSQLVKARFDGSYRISANFLNFVTTKYQLPDLVKDMNAACRQGKYEAEMWKTMTGKSLDDLNDEWKASLDAKTATTVDAKPTTPPAKS